MNNNAGRQSIVVWDVSQVLRSGRTTVYVRGCSDYDILQMVFSPFEDMKIVTCGKENVRFWRVRDEKLRQCSIEWPAGPHHSEDTFTDIAFSLPNHRDQVMLSVCNSSSILILFSLAVQEDAGLHQCWHCVPS